MFWFVKSVPGNIGCALRRAVLPAAIAKGAKVWDGVQIDMPSKLRIGLRTSINRGTILNCGGGITIGDDVLIGPDVIVYSQNHNYKDASRLVAEQGYSFAPVVIGDDVWIAARAVILPGVELGRGAVVASGAVVTKNVPPYTLVGGVPARALGRRTSDSDPQSSTT
ncbi:acyltransferase [Anaeromyxobacter dehalogenans]|uniref:acyltransferase n=1 Tax=Anaeromyxobacter dehalogenans TaxID=161493 RepID=UPI0018DD5046|nr:acyltransferase [Anaeromyxobacter dehalogenans]